MGKRIILVTALVVLSMTGISYALEGGLGVDVDATWVSKYIWRGFDMLDDHAAFQPSVNLNLYDTGFSVNVWSSFPGSSGYSSERGYGSDDSQELHYTVAYSNTLVPTDETFKTNYTVGWRYYDFPDLSSKARDAQEVFVSAEWPNLNLAGLVPHYMYAYLWGAKDDSTASHLNGSVHVIGANYNVTGPDMPLPLTFSGDVVYNDGMYGDAVDHDWSHVLWGVASKITCPMTGGTFKPAFYYQTSMEDTVNQEDEYWVSLSYSLSF